VGVFQFDPNYLCTFFVIRNKLTWVSLTILCQSMFKQTLIILYIFILTVSFRRMNGFLSNVKDEFNWIQLFFCFNGRKENILLRWHSISNQDEPCRLNKSFEHGPCHQFDSDKYKFVLDLMVFQIIQKLSFIFSIKKDFRYFRFLLVSVLICLAYSCQSNILMFIHHRFLWHIIYNS
jgi:hypothetical protein